MSADQTKRSTRNKAHHRARQLRTMADDLRHLPTRLWRWRIMAFALDRLAGLMVLGARR